MFKNRTQKKGNKVRSVLFLVGVISVGHCCPLTPELAKKNCFINKNHLKKTAENLTRKTKQMCGFKYKRKYGPNRQKKSSRKLPKNPVSFSANSGENAKPLRQKNQFFLKIGCKKITCLKKSSCQLSLSHPRKHPPLYLLYKLRWKARNFLRIFFSNGFWSC